MIEVFPSGPLGTNAYVFSSAKDQLTAIIDPAPGSSQEIIPFIQSNQLKVAAILLTHSHWDHIADVKKLKNLYGCPIYLHKEDFPNLINPGSDGLPLMFPIQGIQPDIELHDGDEIAIGEHLLKVIHTPGHSGGSVCFYEPNKHLLFSGDTLFQGTIGNLSFPTSDEARMWGSLDRLAKLPPETVVFPGHGEATTIGDEPWLSKAKDYFGG